MKSTLYLKFIILYIIFGFLSIFTAATLTSGLVRTPLERQIASNMYQEASMVANDYLPQYFSDQLTLSSVQLQLSGMEIQLDAAVWFTDQNGDLLASAHSDGYPSAPDSIEDFNPAEGGSSRYQIGTYHSCFPENVITVTAPVVYGYAPNGYLIIHKYVSDISGLQSILMHAVFITLAVIFVLSFMILLGFQFFVYRPLRKITEAATQYATGNLDYEIPVNTEDEMVIDYLKKLTFLSREEIEEIEKIHHEKPELRVAHKKLAEEVISFLHGHEEYEKALRISEALFSEDITKLSSDEVITSLKGVPSVDVSLDKNICINDAIL